MWGETAVTEEHRHLQPLVSTMAKFDVLVVPDLAVKEAEAEAPLTLFGLNHPRTGLEVHTT